jgi:hypothetical protein
MLPGSEADRSPPIVMLSIRLCDIVLRHRTKFTFHFRIAAMLVFYIQLYKKLPKQNLHIFSKSYYCMFKLFLRVRYYQIVM